LVVVYGVRVAEPTAEPANMSAHGLPRREPCPPGGQGCVARKTRPVRQAGTKSAAEVETMEARG